MRSTANEKTLSGVQLIRSKRRTLSLEIREDLKVRVRAPQWAADKDIASFIESRQAWIERARREISRRITVLRGSGEQGLYWNGQMYPFVIETKLCERFCFSQGRFLIHPLWANESDKTATAWFRKQAEGILESRLFDLAKSVGLNYRCFRLGRARTRWGSCSHDGTITLNWRLVWVPEWVRDYVIFHELCHLKHFDHSRSFWKMVACFSVDYRKAWAWLKEHSGLLTLQLASPGRASLSAPL